MKGHSFPEQSSFLVHNNTQFQSHGWQEWVSRTAAAVYTSHNCWDVVLAVVMLPRHSYILQWSWSWIFRLLRILWTVFWRLGYSASSGFSGAETELRMQVALWGHTCESKGEKARLGKGCHCQAVLTTSLSAQQEALEQEFFYKRSSTLGMKGRISYYSLTLPLAGSPWFCVISAQTLRLSLRSSSGWQQLANHTPCSWATRCSLKGDPSSTSLSATVHPWHCWDPGSTHIGKLLPGSAGLSLWDKPWEGGREGGTQ